MQLLIFLIFFVIFQLVVVLIAFSVNEAKKAKVRQAVAEKPDMAVDIITRWKMRLSPFEFTYGNNFSSSKYLFTLYFFYLVYMEIIIIVSDNEFYIDDAKINSSYCFAMCNFITTYATLDDGRMYVNVLARNIREQNEAYEELRTNLKHSISNIVSQKLDNRDYNLYIREAEQCRIALQYTKYPYKLIDLDLLTATHFDEERIYIAAQRPGMLYTEGYSNQYNSNNEYINWYNMIAKLLFSGEKYADQIINKRIEEQARRANDD